MLQTGVVAMARLARHSISIIEAGSEMMIGVLLFSKSTRTSPWAAVRGSREVLVTGMSEGDRVEIKFKGNGHDDTTLMAVGIDTKFGIPEGADYLMAEHTRVGVAPNVCVDME